MNHKDTKECHGQLCQGATKPRSEFPPRGGRKCRLCLAADARDRRARQTREQTRKRSAQAHRYRERNREAERLRDKRRQYREASKALEAIEQKLVDGDQRAKEDSFHATTWEGAERRKLEQLRDFKKATLAKLEGEGITAENAEYTEAALHQFERSNLVEAEIQGRIAATIRKRRIHDLQSESAEAREARHKRMLEGLISRNALFNDPRFEDANEDARAAGHHAGVRAQSRTWSPSKKAEAYERAYDEAWDATYRPPDGDPMFLYREEDIEAAKATLQRIIEREQKELRDAAAEGLLGDLDDDSDAW